MSHPGSSADAGRLMAKLQGFRISAAMHVAARLELSEQLAAGPRTVEDLAAACAVQAGPLYQVMRALAAEGIYHEEGFGTFVNTDASRLLMREAPGPLWNYALVIGELYLSAFSNLFHAVESGESAFTDRYGMPFWDYLGNHEELGATFDRLMTRIYDGDVESLLELYDFASLGRVLDVGGGRGSFVRALMARNPAVRCGLFDLPAVSARNRAELAADGLADRCEIHAGSFLEALPGGFDAYLVKSVLHNWNDVDALRILKNCRTAGGDTARLVLVDLIVPPGNEPSMAKGMDLTMLAMFGGKERSLAQLERLLGEADYRVEQVVEGRSQNGLEILIAAPA